MSDIDDQCEAASLRVMDEKVRAMNKILSSRIDLEMRLVQNQFESERLARQLNATEILRRLDELNHAHAMRQKDSEMYMRSDVYYASQKEAEAWKLSVVSQIGQVRGWAAAIGFVLLLVQVAFAVWPKKH